MDAPIHWNVIPNKCDPISENLLKLLLKHDLKVLTSISIHILSEIIKPSKHKQKKKFQKKTQKEMYSSSFIDR